MFAVLRAATDMLVSLHGVVGILRQDVSLAPVLHELRQRMLAVLDRALANSRDSGELRIDLEARDLQLVLNMITGALNGIPTIAERATAARTRARTRRHRHPPAGGVAQRRRLWLVDRSTGCLTAVSDELGPG